MLQPQKQKTRFIKKRNIISLILIALMWCITIEPNVVVVNKYKIQDESLKGIKIVFAGDFHVKPYQEKRLQYIVNKINAQNPDIVLLIGDYVNMHEEEWSYPIVKTAEQLSKIESKYGIYTVLGNHDYYQEGKKIKKALTGVGIKVLENESETVKINGKTISIAGIEDLTTGFPSLKKALKHAKNPTILLSHQPDIYPLVPKSVNLTLAGHTRWSSCYSF